MSAAEEKQALRRTMRQLRRELTPESCAESDRKIQDRVLALPEWQAARHVFLYYAVKAEVDTQALLQAAWQNGKTVYLPQCGRQGHMQAMQTDGLQQLQAGAYGIPEPASGQVLDPEVDCLVIVPGLAFDRTGHRLGQGGGYYDRWLGAYSGFFLGLCREKMLLEAVPREAHDRPMDMIVTETEILHF